jgi:hypothetical protein
MADIGSQDWVVSKIGKVRHLFWDVVESAMSRLQRIPAEERSEFNPRTMANVLNCLILAEARTAFASQHGSVFDDRNGTTYHHFNGCVFWYKQLDNDGFPSNYPTDTALELMQGNFPFMPQKVLLVVGFQLDSIAQTVQTVVIHRYSSAGKLKFYITLEKIQTKTRVVEMPTRSSDIVKTKTRIRILRGPEQRDLKAQEND